MIVNKLGYAIIRGRIKPPINNLEERVYSKLGTIAAVALAIFPFSVVLAKLAQTETTAAIVVAAIVVIFFGTLLVATRITVEPEQPQAPRTPAQPIAWSWDGVNRQPGAEDQGERSTEAQH